MDEKNMPSSNVLKQVTWSQEVIISDDGQRMGAAEPQKSRKIFMIAVGAIGVILLTAAILGMVYLGGFIGLGHYVPVVAIPASTAYVTPTATPTPMPAVLATPTPTPTPEPTPPPQLATVGEIVSFGGYAWRVLSVQGNHALVITDRVISHRMYHHVWDSVTWESSEIRQWLNGSFFENFSSQDQARIAETIVVNSGNQWFGTSGGPNTRDRIFLLSIEEVLRYFGDSILPHYRPDGVWGFEDEFGKDRIALDLGGLAAWWWLRSPGLAPFNAAYVSSSGILYLCGQHVFRPGVVLGGVRPALWLSLES